MKPRYLYAFLGSIVLMLTLLLAACDDGTEGEDNGDNGDTGSTATATTEAGDATATPTQSAAGFAPAMALERTAEVTSARFTVEMRFDGIPELPSGAAMTAEGEIDGATQATRMSMDMSSFMQALAAMDPESPGMAEVEAMFGDPVEYVFVDNVIYMKWPIIGQLFGAQTPWVGIPVETVGADAASQLGFGDMADTAEFLAFIEDAEGYEVVGTEDVRGVSTTHYRAQIDLLAASEAFSAGGVSPFDEQELAIFENLDPLPIDAWIDDEGLIRRVSMTVDFAEFAAADPSTAEEFPGSMSFIAEYFDFGETVTIQAPDPSEVTLLDEEVLGQLGGTGAPATQ